MFAKDKAKPDRATKDRSSNASIRTQQQTADAFADKSRKSPTTRPADSADDPQAALADVEDRIRAEDERHEGVLADLQPSPKAKPSAKARKAIDKENALHERNRAALDEQRDSLLTKLGGKPDKQDPPPAAAPPKSDERGAARTPATRTR
jgi:hypothetical protein